MQTGRKSTSVWASLHGQYIFPVCVSLMRYFQFLAAPVAKVGYWLQNVSPATERNKPGLLQHWSTHSMIKGRAEKNEQEQDHQHIRTQRGCKAVKFSGQQALGKSAKNMWLFQKMHLNISSPNTNFESSLWKDMLANQRPEKWFVVCAGNLGEVFYVKTWALSQL